MYNISRKFLIIIWVVVAVAWVYLLSQFSENTSSLVIFSPVLLVIYTFSWYRNRNPQSLVQIEKEKTDKKNGALAILIVSAIFLAGLAVNIYLRGGGAEYMLVLLGIFVWGIILLSYLAAKK